MIVSPDSNYVPVLAYDNLGNFSYAAKDLNPGLTMWFNKHAHEMDFIRNTHTLYTDSIGKVNRSLWLAYGATTKVANFPNATQQKNATPNVTPPVLVGTQPASLTTRSTVGPLCPTFWGQDYPFNYYCPIDPSAANTNYGSHDAAGCVPIAMAQVMYFWGINNPSCFLNYNLASMPLTKQAYLFLPAANDCAKLTHDIGATIIPPVIVNNAFVTQAYQFASYGSATPPNQGTGADNENCSIVFSKFGLSATQTQNIAGQIITGSNNGTYFGSLISNEIQANHWPCVLGGFTARTAIIGPSGDGHEWVCDGSDVTTTQVGTTNIYKDFWGHITYVTTYTNTYVTTLLHMNWGWESSTGQTDVNGNSLPNNGWYDANVNYTQASPSTENFTYYQIVTHNIH